MKQITTFDAAPFVWEGADLVDVPVPYYLYLEAHSRLQDAAEDKRFHGEEGDDEAFNLGCLADAIDSAWGTRDSGRGRPPVVTMTPDQLERLVWYAEDMSNFMDLPAERACGRRFLDKYYRWKNDGTPFLGQSKGQGQSSRDKLPSAAVEEIERIVHRTLKECDRVTWDVFGHAPDLDRMKMRITYSPNQPRSRAGRHTGRPWMSLGLFEFYAYWRATATSSDQASLGFQMCEYKSFAENALIGSALFEDWRDVLRGVVMHEYAHVVQYDYKYARRHYNSKLRGADITGHKDGWRTIYRALRTRLLNDRAICLGESNIRAWREKARDHAFNKILDEVEL